MIQYKVVLMMKLNLLMKNIILVKKQFIHKNSQMKVHIDHLFKN